MPDLSDKVSERDGIPQEVWDASDAMAEFIATALAASILGKATSEDVAVSITKAIANAIMADRRTRPAASTKEGWRTMDSAPKEIGVLELGEDGSVKTTLRPEEFTSAIIAAGTYTIYAAPIPPEVMK